MTNCNRRDRASEIVERAAVLLDEERLAREIDDPVDEALVASMPDESQAFSLRAFHDSIAEFVRQACQRGGTRRNPDRDEALSEALSILESGYQSGSGKGYTAAYRDASDPEQGGIPLVLAQMADWLKAEQRQKRIARVLDGCVSPSDWPLKRQLAAWLALAIPPDPSAGLACCPPAQLAPCWRELLLLYVDAAALHTREAARRLVITA